MFEIWRSIHVPCFHIRQMLEQGKPLQSWNAIDQSNAIHISMKLSEFLAKRQRNQTIFHQNLINVIQSSIRLIKFIGIIYRCNNLRLVRRRLSNHSLYWIKKKLSNSFKFNDCSHVSSKASGVKRNGSNTVNGRTFAHYVLRTYIFYVISVTKPYTKKIMCICFSTKAVTT